MPCRVGREGSHLCPCCRCHSLLWAAGGVKSYEILDADGGRGNRRAAYQALLVHPLGPAADRVGYVLDDLLATNTAYLPQFK